MRESSSVGQRRNPHNTYRQTYFFHQPHASSSLPTNPSRFQPTYASQLIAIYEPSLSRSNYKKCAWNSLATNKQWMPLQSFGTFLINIPSNYESKIINSSLNLYDKYSHLIKKVQTFFFAIFSSNILLFEKAWRHIAEPPKNCPSKGPT